ncbi:HpcH/HpaI aldolase family protein [Peribacillus butanolivorans]|uniref:HpcH/HpaI aldolase family protein n=1 Tax=Peribacillus butanolivorans TaxID=421767 RepID=UPI0036656F12
MSIYLDKIKNKISDGKVINGYTVITADPNISELVGMAGADFVWIDGEHAPLGLNEMKLMLMGARSGGAAGFLRTNTRNADLIKPMLDLGPEAIVFPLIATAKDAEEAVKACLYPPDGIRGLSTMRAAGYSDANLKEYYDNATDSFWRILIIELEEGVKNIEEIVKVEGVDAIVLGPGDLSVDMGLAGQLTHPKLVDALSKVCEACVKYNMPIMAYPMPSGSVENMKMWISKGVRMFNHEYDILSLNKMVKRYNNTAEQAFMEFKSENNH